MRRWVNALLYTLQVLVKQKTFYSITTRVSGVQETLFIILSLHELDVEPLVRKDLKLAELYFAECCFLLHLLPPLKICCVCFVGLATPLTLLTGK